MFQSSIQYWTKNSLCWLVQARQNEPSSILVQDNVYVFLDFVFASAFQDWLFWQYRQRSFINVSYRLRTSNPVFGIAAVNDSSVGHYIISTGSSWPSILTAILKRSFKRPYQTLSGFSTNRFTPGGRVKTKSSRLYFWYVLLRKGQHCRRWCPTCIVWPICHVSSPSIAARI